MKFSKNEIGMTLPEVLVVLLILTSTFVLVAPLSIDRVEKSQLKFEITELRSLLKAKLRQADWANQDFLVEFRDNSAIFSQNKKPVLIKKFKKLTFKKQKLVLSKTGLASQCEITLAIPNEKIKGFNNLCIEQRGQDLH